MEKCKQNKLKILTLYNLYIKILCDKIKNVNESILQQVRKIEDEEFSLMVLGEAKSGKSTFINAFLGKEIVPMDVRQCTSAIIKIRNGDEFKLVATSASGKKILVSEKENITKFLRDNATILDQYRNIPIATINNEILIKYKGENIDESTLNDFLEEELRDNIYQLEPEEYKKLIRKYISENKAGWGEIITEIEIMYPFPEQMKGITIIDSPGVGAGGNFGKITEDYIKNADAIIFLKSLSGQAVESTSFMNFFRSNCADRAKETLFLVFTGKATLQQKDFLRIKDQAIEMYKNYIEEEKILFVDSKMQLFLNRCRKLETEKAINEYFETLENEGDDFPPASICWLKADGDIFKFESKMKENANFVCVNSVIEKFAKIAIYLQFIRFLETLEKECKKYKESCENLMRDVKKNTVNFSANFVALNENIIVKRGELDSAFCKIREVRDMIDMEVLEILEYKKELTEEYITFVRIEKQEQIKNSIQELVLQIRQKRKEIENQHAYKKSIGRLNETVYEGVSQDQWYNIWNSIKNEAERSVAEEIRRKEINRMEEIRREIDRMKEIRREINRMEEIRREMNRMEEIRREIDMCIKNL